MNLICMNHNGRECNVFFNIDAKTQRVTDIRVTGERMSDPAWEITGPEREALVKLIAQEYILSAGEVEIIRQRTRGLLDS